MAASGSSSLSSIPYVNKAPVGSAEYNFIQAGDPNKILPPDKLAEYNSLLAQQSAYDAQLAASGRAYTGAGGPVNVDTSNRFTRQADALLAPYLPKDYQKINDLIGNSEGKWDAQGNFVNTIDKGSFLDQTLDKFAPLVAIGGAGYAFAPFIGGGLGGAGEAESGVAAVTPESLAYTTDSLLADTAALGGASTDVVVTGSALGGGAAGGIGAGVGAGLGAAAGSGLSALPDISSGPAPTVNVAKPWTQYLPKNVISRELQSQGLNATASNIIGGAGQGSLTSELMGGDPLKGAIIGSIAPAVTATGLPAGVSEAVGGGTLGKIAGAATTGALTGAGAGVVTGGDIGLDTLAGAASGGLASGVSSGLQSEGVGSGVSGVIGSGVGSAIGANIVKSGADFTPASTGNNMAATDTTGTTPTTGSTPDTTGTSSGFGDILKSIGGLIGGLPVASTIEAGIGLSEASKQKAENAALAKKLTDQATPLLTSGQEQLKNYQTLNPTEQAALDAGKASGLAQEQLGNPLIGIGQSAMNQFGSGQLPPAQQAALDRSVAAAKAQAAQSMGSQVDSSTMAQVNAAIDAKAAETKQSLMDANLTTGESAYGKGAALETAGADEITAAYNQATADINNNLSNALTTITDGLGPLEEAIRLQIEGDTALTASLNAMFAAIANGATQGGKGGKGGSGSTIGDTIGKVLNAVKGWGGSNTSNILSDELKKAGYTNADLQFPSVGPTTPDYFGNLSPVDTSGINVPVLDQLNPFDSSTTYYTDPNFSDGMTF